MQFQVPQFINIEDKIIGPLTLKQFLWLLPAAGILFITWTYVDLGIFILIAIPVIGIFGALGFVKINGRSLISFLASAIGFYSKPKLYLWKRKTTAQRPIFAKKLEKKEQDKTTAAVTKNNIQKLAEKLDTA